MVLRKPEPLILSLKKAEIAARPAAPFVVGRSSNPGLIQDPHYIAVIETVVFEWEDGANIRLCTSIPIAVFISTYRDVRDDVIFADPTLKWLDL